MAEYIEREKLLAKLHEVGGCGAAHDTWADGYDKAIDVAYGIVQMTPAADVAEIKRGKWEKDGNGRTCSKCEFKYYANGGLFNYCPNCGARMDGERG